MSSSLPKLDKKAYEDQLEKLQAELVEMQQWVVETGARIVIVMEGRDAAGKGSAIKRITQYLNPRVCRVEALPAPNSREQGQWYFQRYIEKLPTAGEIVIFDRSWYNRAGVERVMGFCTTHEYRRFLHQAPIFERLLVEDGILLRKYWFSVSDEEQVRRFKSRQSDPMRQWKLSPMDLQSITRWEDYSRAKDEMFVHTDIPSAPWYTVESEDKKRSRINVITHLLSTIPWEYVEKNIPKIPERPESTSNYERPPRTQFRYVPDAAAELEKDRVKAREDAAAGVKKAEKKADDHVKPVKESKKKSDKKAKKPTKKSAKKASKKSAKKSGGK
ncbi:polyphosphate kinase 2 [Corynebacterium auriscanis]|uniref:ADP/GDP-polyphosphate phosphotransferase n=1 Tax=Corynebacterium auriscanis TaxID=99807 RepID=A0A0A2DGX8_9CORY|nr:polyphosphate kinase 2 [Corynebacterium auriscanis]KGM18420.1 transcriptional regulator [Corynebacterium auriscanis]WJY73286.1 Polyphosphate kinase 2 (PPK2) [Corynebacterium auriscanis]